MTTGQKTPALPPSGPLEQWPDVTPAQAVGMLERALSGLTMGPVDHAVREGLSGLDPAMCAAVAGWLRRTFAAGLRAGRAEAVDEAPAVQAARAKSRATTKRLTKAQADRAQAYGWWRNAAEERDQARDDLKQLVTEIQAAAMEADLVADDDTADARLGLGTLLTRLKHAITPRTKNNRRR